MTGTICCLVDPNGKVYVKDGAESYAEVAAACGLTEGECEKYRFNLTTRRLFADRATPVNTTVVRIYLDQRMATPEKLMQFAEEGHLSKDVLASLLNLESRRSYLDSCANVEKTYTEACAAKDDPCLASGCSMDQVEGDICLQPLLNAGADYHKACATEWVKVFRSPQNRTDAWRN